MKNFLMLAACVAMLVFAPLAHADYVCRRDPLQNEYLSVRARPAGAAIEVGRLSPRTLITVQGPPQNGWVRIAVPIDGWALAQYVCPGQPR
jgi:hypothetical protein